MKFRLLALAAMVAVIPTANAAIAFNNFGPGDSFNTGSGGTIGGPTGPVGYLIQGEGFNSLASGQVSTITLAYGHVTGTNSATFRLYSGTPTSFGSLMASWVVTGMPGFGSGLTFTINNTNPAATLVMGNDYWLVAESASDAWQAWNNNNIGDTGPHTISSDGTNYNFFTGSRNTFRVEVSPVPEPATMAILGAGALALAARRRRKI